MHVIPITIDSRLLSVAAVAGYLKVRRRWVYDAVARDYLPCRRIGKLLRFAGEDINLWLLSECLRGDSSGSSHDGSILQTVDELAAYLGVSKSWIYEARRSRGLPHFKLQRHLRFSHPLVEAWLREHAPSGLMSLIEE